MKGRKTFRGLAAAGAAAYVLILMFPQVFFANELAHKGLTAYSRSTLDPSMESILDSAQARLEAAAIYDPEIHPRIFLCESHGFYSFLSAGIRAGSFGKTFAALPSENVFINQSDPRQNLVFRKAPTDNQRKLDEVIAHEATHLLLRKKLGFLENITAPRWKKEGYCEYVAGGSTLSEEEGVRRWKASPDDDSHYRYFKYRMLVKHLLETKAMPVEEFFAQKIDLAALELEVLSKL